MRTRPAQAFAALSFMVASAASASIVNFNGASYEISGVDGMSYPTASWRVWGTPQMCTTGATNDFGNTVEYTWSNFASDAVFGTQLDLDGDRIVARFFHTKPGSSVRWLSGPAISGFLIRDVLDKMPDFVSAALVRSQSETGAKAQAIVIDANTLLLNFQQTASGSFRNLEEAEFQVTFLPSPGTFGLLLGAVGVATRRRR